MSSEDVKMRETFGRFEYLAYICKKLQKMDKVKRYIISEDAGASFVEEPVHVRVSPNTDINTLRHSLMDAAYATNDNETIYKSLLVLLKTTSASPTPLKDKMQKRLEELSKLPDGWDGEGSLSIDRGVVDFVHRVIMISTEQSMENWVLFPDARGYLYFDYTQEKNIGGITISSHKIVAFIKKNGQLVKYNFDKLSEEDVVKVLEDAHE